jgi:glyoxylase-like metal-dependent hydrolase (beta-lactamase superfamily II)
MGDHAQWRVGDVSIAMLIERHSAMAADNFVPKAGGELARHRDWLSPWALEDADQLRFVIQALCLEADGQKVVVDTCIGSRQLPEMYAGLENDGSFIEALRDAGFGRDDVDLVICTHLHFDHVGWNTIREHGRWVPTFRKARYVVVRGEYEHWKTTSDEVKATSNVLNFDDSVEPLFAAGVADLVDTDHQVSRSLQLLPTPGHTPAHVSVLVTSQGDSALITGDCAHHPVQLAEPDWYSVADWDPEQSGVTRRRITEEFADRPVLIIGTHFPPPSAGHLVTTEDGIRFRPAGWDEG